MKLLKQVSKKHKTFKKKSNTRPQKKDFTQPRSSLNNVSLDHFYPLTLGIELGDCEAIIIFLRIIMKKSVSCLNSLEKHRDTPLNSTKREIQKDRET